MGKRDAGSRETRNAWHPDYLTRKGTSMAGNIVQKVDDWMPINHVLVSVWDKAELEVLVRKTTILLIQDQTQ